MVAGAAPGIRDIQRTAHDDAQHGCDGRPRGHVAESPGSSHYDDGQGCRRPALRLGCRIDRRADARRAHPRPRLWHRSAAVPGHKPVNRRSSLSGTTGSSDSRSIRGDRCSAADPRQADGTRPSAGGDARAAVRNHLPHRTPGAPVQDRRLLWSPDGASIYRHERPHVLRPVRLERRHPGGTDRRGRAVDSGVAGQRRHRGQTAHDVARRVRADRLRPCGGNEDWELLALRRELRSSCSWRLSGGPPCSCGSPGA